MLLIRKFYDTAVADQGGITETIEQTQPSIAEMLAKHGTKNSSSEMVATPIQIQRSDITPEKKEESTSVQEPTPAATATETPNAEQANSETPLPEKVEAPQPAPQKEEAAKYQPSWQEVLKSQQPDTILKELGYDDKVVSLAKKLNENPKMAAFFNHWETKGDVKDYLRELTTEYKSMPAEEVMRHQLRKEYPNASNAALEVLYKKEVIKSYGLDSDDETELEEGRLLLEAKADRYRTEMIKNQENYLLSQPPEPKVAEPDNTEQLVQQEINAQKSYVLNSDYVRNVAANKVISFGEGDEKFNYPIDNPSELVDIIYDSEKWLTTIFDKKSENGKDIYIPKSENQLLLGLVAKHGKTFFDAYAKHFKSLGGNEAIAPIENASQNGNVQKSADPQSAPKTAAEAMARQGTYNSGGYR